MVSPRMTNRVSFMDSSLNVIQHIPVQKRNKSVGVGLRRNTFNNNVVNKNDLTFPPFIPDDPEMPHLSCRKKERKRQALIREIVKEILNYKAGEWSHESMQNQDNMFDKASTDSQIYWGKLAMNVLFSCNSKSVVKKYREERDEYVDPDWERTDSTRMTAIEKSLNIKKRASDEITKLQRDVNSLRANSDPGIPIAAV